MSHVQSPGHRLESSHEKGLYIIFPSFKTKAIIGSHDIYLDATPLSSEGVSNECSSPLRPIPVSVCHDLTVFQNDIKLETDRLDTILRDLRQYFTDVKTKRKLGLDVPSGFRRQSLQQKNARLYTPPRHSEHESSNIHNSSSFSDDTSPTSVNTPVHSKRSSDLEPLPLSQTCTSSSSDFVPIVRSVDKPSSSLPQTITMTEDNLRACVGFCRIDTMKTI